MIHQLSKLFTVLALVGIAAGPVWAQQRAAKPERYVVAGDAGAKLRNLADAGAKVVLDAQKGTVLAVYGERAGYLDVEAPGGVSCWVFGRSLRATGVPGVLEVTKNRVTMRPLPNSDITSYPLPQLLSSGDRVWVIARNDATKPLAEDWVNIWSPPGVRAWVKSTETGAIPAGKDGKSLWNDAAKKLLSARKPVDLSPKSNLPRVPEEDVKQTATTGVVEASSQVSASAMQEARTLLIEADKLYDAARATNTADYGPARNAYERVLVLASTGHVADRARARLSEITAREELHAMKADHARAKEERAAERTRLEKELEEARLTRTDPLIGKFQSRGWLEKEERRGEDPVYTIHWAGMPQSEVVCASGRYDLELYVGFEIGIVGGASRAPVPASAGARPRPIQYEVMKVEVISGRGR